MKSKNGIKKFFSVVCTTVQWFVPDYVGDVYKEWSESWKMYKMRQSSQQTSAVCYRS